MHEVVIPTDPIACAMQLLTTLYKAEAMASYIRDHETAGEIKAVADRVSRYKRQAVGEGNPRDTSVRLTRWTIGEHVAQERYLLPPKGDTDE